MHTYVECLTLLNSLDKVLLDISMVIIQTTKMKVVSGIEKDQHTGRIINVLKKIERKHNLVCSNVQIAKEIFFFAVISLHPSTAGDHRKTASYSTNYLIYNGIYTVNVDVWTR